MSEVENSSQPKYAHIRRKNLALRSGASLAILSLTASVAGTAHAQQMNDTAQLPEIIVSAPITPAAYATEAQYNTSSANLGPLGEQSILNTPTSVTVVPEDLIVNQQAQTVNDTLRYLPSVEVRDQQGFEVSRPQSRGFQGSIVQNTRLDGLNIVGTTAIPAENLSSVQVLNGLAGSLYGPETPAGVFNYVLKRPTDVPLERFIEGYDADGVWTEQMDLGGRTGNDGNIGYRVNAVHGEGESYVPGSNVNRTLLSADLDFHIDHQTVIETDFSHYESNITGLPGSIVYDTNKGANTSTLLPAAVDPTRVGYGQPGAGADLVTNTGLVKLKHQFNDQWNLEVGALYQDSVRNLFGISNIMTNNAGNYTETKNFSAIPHYTIASNTLSLNGHVNLFGLKNDVTIATNGFTNYQYSYRNSIVVSNPTVANLANPVVLSFPATPNNGGQYESAAITEQSIITGDTIHFNDKLALQGVLNTSFLSSKSFNTAGQVTSANKLNGVVSPTVSLIYKPVPRLTTYVTAASSVEQGEQAPAGTANANQFMAPYHDRQYEVGAKYASSDNFLVTLAAFSMTRPLANTNASNIFSVVGTQRNNGLELFAQGNALPDLSVFGGVTYIDARLNGTGSATTNNMLVVGVPRVKTDIALDYHPTFAEGFALTGAAHYESERAATDTNNSFAPSYATFDTGLRYSSGYRSHRWTARLQMLNVTNKFYYSSIADGNIVGSPGANTAYLGAPRTLMASLEIDY